MKSMQLISYTSYVVTYIMLHQHLYSLSFKTTVSEKKNKGAVQDLWFMISHLCLVICFVQTCEELTFYS